ncbi:MAG: hypothetical protein RI957_1980, partial [Verrucomicrobiota bacterium]
MSSHFLQRISAYSKTNPLIYLMSLHAQLSPEAQARLDAMKRNSTISSIIIAILSIVLIGLLLAFIFIQP